MQKFKVIEFQTISLCNSDCIICPWHWLKKQTKSEYLPDNLWKKLLDELKEIQPERIIPYLNNEPLLDANIFDKINALKSIVPGCTMELSTNGSLLDADKIDALLKSPVDDILISVFGHDEESEKKLMNPTFSYQKIVDNVLELSERNNKLQNPKNVAVVKVVNSPFADKQLLQDNIDFWKKHKVKVLQYGFLNRAGNIENICERNNLLLPRGCELNRHKERIYMYADGTITFCCHDWKKMYKVGDFNVESLMSVWNSRDYADLRKKVDGEELSENDFLCRYCKLCPEK